MRVFLLFCMMIASGLGTAGSAVAQDSLQVRVVGDGQVSRVTVWLPQPVKVHHFVTETVSRQEIVLDLDGLGAPDVALQPIPATTGVSGYSWQGGQLRLALARPMMVARRLELPPAGSELRHRVVLDLSAVSDVRFAKHAEQDVAQLAKLMDSRRKAEREAASEHAVAMADKPASRRHTIVIDPGHGGSDPGASAVTGEQEKDIVLAASRELRDLLIENPHYDVRMTREDDTYISLEDRVSLARDWGADLFISIHADAAGNASVSGASVYTISARGEGRVDVEAKKNDWTMPIEQGVSEDVSVILEDLIKLETRTNSGLFAEQLLPRLEAAGPVLRNTHRNAGFYVLLAPDVPAVLLEMGFLTNRADAQRLRSAKERLKAMQAVRGAIDAYFERQDLLLAGN